MTAKKLKILMLGWEFPPILTGGLGPACYGLAKALSPSVDLHLILPQADAELLLTNVRITGLNQLDFSKLQEKKLRKLKMLKQEIEEKVNQEKLNTGSNHEAVQKAYEQLSEEKERAINTLKERTNQAIKATLKSSETENNITELVKKEIFEKIREERMLYSYEDFAVVDYVNVSLDPYCSAWEAKGKIISKKVEKKIITSTLKKTVIEKEQKTFAQFHKTRASQEKIEALQKEMDNELQQLNYFYEQAKENLQFPSLNNTEEKYASSAIDKELEEMVAFDWAYKQYLFNDQDTYGPKVMDKVAAYTEAVMHYASLQDFDVIHAHDWLTFPAAVAIKKQSKKPLVIHVHSLETDRTTNPQARNTVYDIEKKAMGMANMVVSVSQYTKECIEKNYQIESHKIQAVHNGIEPYNPALKATPKTVNTILFLGRVTPQKGILYLIETASILLKKIENVQFLIAGIGDQLREAMLLSQQKGISDKIKFLGFLSQEKVKETLAETDVFFMPSVSEPFGLAALEAAQFGIPLVLSKQTGAAELLPNSLRANYWETEKFANYLYATLQYKGLKNELRNATLEDVNYATWEVSATAVHQIYKKVIADEFTDNLAPRKND